MMKQELEVLAAYINKEAHVVWEDAVMALQKIAAHFEAHPVESTSDVPPADVPAEPVAAPESVAESQPAADASTTQDQQPTG